MNNYSENIRFDDFKPKVLGEQLSQILIDAILEGSIKQGEQLIEVELQKLFKVSRSPLREAFRELEKKGLVEIIPRKGTFVRSITIKDINENFPVRAALEGLAAREACGKLSSEEINRMKKAFKAMESAAGKKKFLVYSENHTVFHDIFIQACGNELLIHMLNTLRMHRLWYFLSYQYQREDSHKAIAIHKKILKFFESDETDPNDLELLVRTHIEEALEKFSEYVRNLE